MFRRAEVCRLGIKEAEAFVMLGGHHHVFLAGAFCQARPIARGVRFGIEALRQFLIFGGWNPFHLHHPFVTAQNAVQAPVNEHTELRFVPPLHAALAVGDDGWRFGRRFWLLRRLKSLERAQR